MSFKQLRRQILYVVFRGLAFPLELLPLSLSRKVGAGLGFLVWVVGSPLRRQARQGLTAAFPGEGPGFVRRTTRRMFLNLGRVLGESFYLSRRSKSRVEDLVAGSSGLEHMARLAAKGRGAVVVTPHLGNFELLAAWLYRRFDGVVVEKRSQGSAFTDYLRRRREHLGMKTMNQESSPRPLLRELKAGRFVGLLPDQDMDQIPGIFIPFFGKTAYTATAPASLARLGKVNLITAFIVWTDRGYEVRVEEPLEVSRTPDKDEDVHRATEAWSAAFERVIREHPEQWVWIHPRWKTTPERLQQKRKRRRERQLRAQQAAAAGAENEEVTV